MKVGSLLDFLTAKINDADSKQSLMMTERDKKYWLGKRHAYNEIIQALNNPFINPMSFEEYTELKQAKWKIGKN